MNLDAMRQHDNINGKCLCTAGFYGDFCEKKIDFCMSKPCVHGYCESTLSGFKCKCYEGYSGDTCSSIFDMCTVSSCSGRGRCTPVWNATMCTCDKRWRGKHCDQLLDECMDVPCENDGVCETTSDRCEVVGSCLKQPCERGECIQFSNNTHLCNCPTGYEGKNCEKRIDYCVKNPCLNEGSCESLIDQYKCHCVPGFKGINCETNIDECLFGFCSNGSTCRDRIADYDCICDGTGFQGKNCTIDIDECTVTSNCVNGQCTNTHGSYRCDCEDGFIGSRCSVRDPCRPDAFNRTTHTCVHGVCINPTVQRDDAGHETSVHECKCHWGYTGSQCLVKVSEQKMLALSRVLGPMIVVLSVLAILGCVLFVIVFRGKRALHGHYSPSYQEQNGARLQMNSMVKLPPEERLI
ncbi:EGF-like domain protein [Dictyocaulus viviparus]|uniref:EGF-like domain protein n=1 Tax=Dictyocaulus viviparus TaxID=29172 RepID=A0A0D8XXR6_DICVI|nr:EGF-like domain protein [Dictyocaulus viviparus]